MLVEDLLDVRLWAPQARFYFQQEPEYAFTDFPWQWMTATLQENDNIIADTDLQCVLPAPLRVPHNNYLTASVATEYDTELAVAVAESGIDTALPLLTWSKTAAHTMATKFLPIWGTSTDEALGLYVYAEEYVDADTGTISLDCPIDCNAFSAEIGARTQPVKALGTGAAGGTSTTPNAPVYSYVAVSVGTGADEVWYRVVATQNGDFRIEKETATESRLLELVARPQSKGASETDYSVGARDQRVIAEFRLVAGRMSIKVGDMARTFGYVEDRGFWKFEKAKAEAAKVVSMTLECSQIRWRSHTAATSPEVTTGFTSSYTPDTSFVRANEEAVAAVPALVATVFSLDSAASSLTGPTVDYRMKIDGPEDGEYRGVKWSKYGVAVRSILIHWPGYVTYNMSAPVFPGILASTVRHSFDSERLEIASSASLSINANKRQELPTGETGTWGEWMMNYGQLAVEIYSSRTNSSGAMSAPALTFTGYAATKARLHAASASAIFQMECQDRRRQMMSPVWDLPWMDGWNVFYAACYLAQLGGITRSDLAFAASVPMGPYDDSLDEEGNPAYFLPVGSGGSVITRHSGEVPWEILAKIGLSIGYMRFFNLQAQLEFRKFRIPSGTKRIFYETDREAELAGGRLEGCWEIEVLKDMDTVRSDVIVAGVLRNYQWNEILAQEYDSGVVYDPNAFNHLGYPNRTVWMDSRFSEQAFADDAALSIHRFQRVPSLAVSLTTWIQPDIYPLDVIMVDSPKCGTSAIRLVVLDVEHHQALGMIASSRITGIHFVPDW